MPKRLDNKARAEVHNKLKGFDIGIDPFGQIISNTPIEKISQFLDEEVIDKKLQSRHQIQKSSEEE